jgi:hypothetical protein
MRQSGGGVTIPDTFDPLNDQTLNVGPGGLFCRRCSGDLISTMLSNIYAIDATGQSEWRVWTSLIPLLTRSFPDSKSEKLICAFHGVETAAIRLGRYRTLKRYKRSISFEQICRSRVS